MSNVVRHTQVKLHSPKFLRGDKETKSTMRETDVSEINLDTFSPATTSPIQGSKNNVDRFTNPHSGTDTYSSIRRNQAAIPSVPSVIKQEQTDSTTMFNMSSSTVSRVKSIIDLIVGYSFLGVIFKRL